MLAALAHSLYAAGSFEAVQAAAAAALPRLSRARPAALDRVQLREVFKVYGEQTIRFCSGEPSQQERALASTRVFQQVLAAVYALRIPGQQNDPIWLDVVMQRSAKRWVRAAGAHPGRLQMAALISATCLRQFAGDLDGCQWWQAADAITAAGFRAALGAMHSLLAARLAAAPGGGGGPSAIALPSLARMVAGMLNGWRLLRDAGPEEPLPRVYAALLLGSPEFRGDLLQLLLASGHEQELADAWAAAAAAALCLDGLSSAQGRALASDQRLAEALLACLAADAGSGQDAAKLVMPWLDFVSLLVHMEDRVLAAALAAAGPQRTADVVHSLLAAAASLGSPADEQPVFPPIVTEFACTVVVRYGSSITQQGRQRILSVPGLPRLLVDCVAHRLKCNEEGGSLGSISNCLWMLKLVLEEVPASSELQPLTQQQLERMQLLQLLKQHPLHRCTPGDSWTASSLHPAGLDILCRTAQLRGERQLLQRYWAEVGVGHVQALLAAVAAGPGSGSGGPRDEEATLEWLDNCARCVRAWGRMIGFMAAAGGGGGGGGGGGAEPLQQLEVLGVWRLLAQLVEATGDDSGWQEANSAARSILLTHPPAELAPHQARGQQAAAAPAGPAAEPAGPAAEPAAAQVPAASTSHGSGQQRPLPVCAACGSTTPKLLRFMVCSGCGRARYCDRGCQVAHWRVHKRECGGRQLQGGAEGAAGTGAGRA